MKPLGIIFLLLPVLTLVSCITIVVAPTPAPAVTAPAALPVATAQPVPAGTCIPWTDVLSHVAENLCVRGTVRSATKQGSTFFINFDNASDSFYAVSFKHTWDDLRGKCVEINGRIAIFRGRPQIVIEDKEQLGICK